MHLRRIRSSARSLVRFLALVKVQLGLIAAAGLMGILLANSTGHSSIEQTPLNGKISMKAVSWKLVKKLAEPDAGLRGHKVAVLDPADNTVVASGITDRSGYIEFEIPEGTYTLLGASDAPETVHVQAGQTAKFKLVVH
jgi:hypothetical protein